MSDTIAAVATGAGVSAIGIVRVSGPLSVSLMDALFRPADGKTMSQHRDRQLVYGALLDEEGRTLDLCLCTLSRAPRSYTGEDTAELQCHGSPVVLRSALEALFALGARQAAAGEFTKRAFLNGRMDLTQAEAVVDIIDAETPLAARNAASQLGGAISRRTEEIYQNLTHICSHYHAVLDYPDEDIPPFTLAEYAAVLDASIRSLEALLATFSRGQFLEKGVRTAILGRPNAGKSSLLNALLGFERAIVTDIPGTTRDTLSERCLLGGVALRLTDTAGVRETSDAVESLGVERAIAAAEEAQLVIAVFDLSRPWDAEDEAVLAIAEKAAVRIAAANKSDCAPRWDVSRLSAHFDSVCVVSAREKTGLDALGAAVAAAFPMPEADSGEILTNARQADAVRRARGDGGGLCARRGAHRVRGSDGRARRALGPVGARGCDAGDLLALLCRQMTPCPAPAGAGFARVLSKSKNNPWKRFKNFIFGIGFCPK